MKKVLMVVYSYPPVKNAGSERAVSFINQLHSCGWEPLVLTHSVHSQSAPDNGGQVPEGIDVIRSSSWNSKNLPGFMRNFADFLSTLLVPDRERLWEVFSVRKASRLAKYEGVDLIYTVSPPSSAHLMGLRLKKKYPGIPWVADICNPSPDSQVTLRERYERKLAGRILNEADCIITGNKMIYEDLQAKWPEQMSEETVTFIPDGSVQELSEQFEKACRMIAARKIVKNNE
jgi:predicted house-cleaning noncanonical NTP pyrophosphatase (MazG superfamily)